MLVRRLLFLWLLMLWQGGFQFYATVVVTVGTEVLGSPLEQGQITQRVTNWLNVAGAVALAAWAWDIAVEPSPRPMRLKRWLVWLFLAAALGVLVWLHPLMDDHMNADTFRVTDREGFHELHRWYLRVSTAQWAASVILSWWTLAVWTTQPQRDAEQVTPGTVGPETSARP